MKIERLKKIIEYSEKNGYEIEKIVQDFYEHIGMDSTKELRNVMQLVRPAFQEKNYIIVELPFKDKEIGAVCYKGDELGYTFLNTSLPKVNVNFALCHEIYHLFYQKTNFRKMVELYINEHYYEYEEELAANLFAGMLTMPEKSFRFMFNKFEKEATANDTNLSLIVKLMSYYEVPYMAALIRCYELKLLDSGDILEELMNIDSICIRNEFVRLWLDDNILNATKKDDYVKLEMLVEYFGEKYSEKGYLSNRTVEKAIKNMRDLYVKIKGD